MSDKIIFTESLRKNWQEMMICQIEGADGQDEKERLDSRYRKGIDALEFVQQMEREVQASRELH